MTVNYVSESFWDANTFVALLLLLCGLAVTMFYMQDEKEGLFLWMPIKNRKKYCLCSRSYFGESDFG